MIQSNQLFLNLSIYSWTTIKKKKAKLSIVSFCLINIGIFIISSQWILKWFKLIISCFIVYQLIFIKCNVFLILELQIGFFSKIHD